MIYGNKIAKELLSIKFLGFSALLLFISITSTSISYSQNQMQTQTDNQTSLITKQEGNASRIRTDPRSNENRFTTTNNRLSNKSWRIVSNV
jgi:hypothetical protein